MVRTWEIELDWLNSKCGANAAIRRHYLAVRKDRKEKKEYAMLVASKLPKAVGDTNIPMSIVFNTPTKRRLDLDNALSAIKGEIDGISKAIGVDDGLFHPITIDYGTPGKPGSVKVELRYEAIK